MESQDESMQEQKQGQIGEKIVVAPPLVKRLDALEFTDPRIPGEIKLDKSGKLLKRWFSYEGKIGSLIDQYNNFITNILPQIIGSRGLTLPSGNISFENIILNRPIIRTTTGAQMPLYPNMARDSGYSYTSDIYVDLVQNKGEASEERLEKVYIGKIPVMLGSSLDWLTIKSEKEKTELGESINDPGAYFVIKGAEKIILIQEKLRANRFFVFNSTSKGDVIVKITNNTLSGSSQITMAKGKKSGAIKIHLGFMKRSKGISNKLGNTMSVFQIYRLLGVRDSKEILKYISLFTKAKHMKRIFVTLQPTFVKLSKIGDDIEYISKKIGLGNIDYSIRKADILRDLTNQLFPQIPAQDLTGKLYMLSMMVVRLLEYLIGVRDLDDRDNWGNKQLVSAGKSMELLFSSIWREAIQKAQDDIDTKKLSGLKAAQRALDPAFITDNFIESFTANNWGVQSSYLAKENITDILKRDSVLSVFSHLTKINTPTSSKAKSPKLRMVQMSQLGYVDAAETPEGPLCLAKGTPILMADGTWKPIGEISEGEEVITVNPITFERVSSKIINPFCFHTKNSNKKVYRLTTLSGNSIEATGDHPFLSIWIEDKEDEEDKKDNLPEWVTLEKLIYEHRYICLISEKMDITFEKIKSIEQIEDIEVADFTTVHENHSFIADGFVTHNCGLTKNASMTTYISLDRPEDVVVEMIGKYVSKVPTETSPNPFMLNGVFKGWVDGKTLKDFAVLLRRGLMLAKDTSIVLERDGTFNIYTDACRPTRPLLIVDKDGKLVIEKKNLWDADFETLLREGCAEYIDAWEQESIMLAQKMDDVSFRKMEIEMATRAVKEAEEKLSALYNKNQKGMTRISSTQSILNFEDMNSAKRNFESTVDSEGFIGSRGLASTTLSYSLEEEKNLKIILSQAQATLKELVDLTRYTHSEMDPSAIMSIAVGVIPLPETNPGPRLTYQAGMGKQALGIYHSNHASRFDTTSKVLAYPSRPMFETQINEVIGLNELPAGETVIVAITTYSGFAQEDAIVMAQGAIDRGLFRQTVYKTYKTVLKRTRTTVEKYARPEIKKGDENRYVAIDENGLPKLGSFVKEGDCLIGKVRKNLTTGAIENASSFVEVKQEGVVDRVLVSTNPEGARVVKVKIRQIRKPVMGDKFACYTPDHEILTLNRSWIPISSLTKTDMVATLFEGEIHYENPEEIQSYDYNGKMYEISSNKISLCVTPNHRMYVKCKDKFEIIAAEDLYGKKVTYKNLNEEISFSGTAKDNKEQWVNYTGKVHCCTVRSGIIYVRRNGKPIWSGNSRYAQKGTIGLILPDEDMPFTASGIRPDILINSHCIPSRMTVGKLIEIVSSKVAAFTGERVNATAFRKFDVTEFMRNLKQYGYAPSGKERMYSGYTGKPLEALIFTGPCYYQALRHQVVDKIQMRARGGISQLTHQPVGGRKRGGGQRIGEMERDAIISHGASAFLQERLCLVSDSFESVYCSTCGLVAIANHLDDKYICRTCEEGKASFGRCQTPYAFKLLSQLLQGANYKIAFKMREVPKEETK